MAGQVAVVTVAWGKSGSGRPRGAQGVRGAIGTPERLQSWRARQRIIQRAGERVAMPGTALILCNSAHDRPGVYPKLGKNPPLVATGLIPSLHLACETQRNSGAVTWRRSGIGGKVAKILICEDDELYRQLAEVAFASSGHDVEFLDSGYAVMRKLESGSYDLLITDIVMPDKDGLEVIREIRGRGYSLPVLVMSGGMSSLKAPILAAAQALGADEVITKPFRPPALREQAEKLLKVAEERLLGQTA